MHLPTTGLTSIRHQFTLTSYSANLGLEKRECELSITFVGRRRDLETVKLQSNLFVY